LIRHKIKYTTQELLTESFVLAAFHLLLLFVAIGLLLLHFYADFCMNLISISNCIISTSFQKLGNQYQLILFYQDWIRLLKCEKLFSVLKWFGRQFHNVAAANLKERLFYRNELTYPGARPEHLHT
jgi:hypothetical protein